MLATAAFFPNRNVMPSIFTEKERHKELVGLERAKIEENIECLTKDIQREEAERQKKKELLVEELDQQVEEKKKIIDKTERFRESNELASRLSKFQMNINEPVISVSHGLLIKWLSRCFVFLHYRIFAGEGPSGTKVLS